MAQQSITYTSHISRASSTVKISPFAVPALVLSKASVRSICQSRRLQGEAPLPLTNMAGAITLNAATNPSGTEQIQQLLISNATFNLGIALNSTSNPPSFATTTTSNRMPA